MFCKLLSVTPNPEPVAVENPQIQRASACNSILSTAVAFWQTSWWDTQALQTSLTRGLQWLSSIVGAFSRLET